MSVPPIYRFQRGEPIVIGREVVSGDPEGYSVDAVLKRTSGQVVPKASTEASATFDVAFEPAQGSGPGAIKARWLLTIPATVTANLSPGQYAADARFLLDGEVVQITDPVFITLAESISGASG
jgi:transglutaminase-like putative cysteine protease